MAANENEKKCRQIAGMPLKHKRENASHKSRGTNNTNGTI